MNRKLCLSLAAVFAGVFALSAHAADGTLAEPEPLLRPAGDSDLSEFVWKKRPIVVFADTANDSAFVEQLELLSRRPEALIDRDVIVLTDTDPAAMSPVRKKLRPSGFMLVIIGKDGGVKLRKPLPWDVREISRSIDKMPIRKREINERTNR